MWRTHSEQRQSCTSGNGANSAHEDDEEIHSGSIAVESKERHTGVRGIQLHLQDRLFMFGKVGVERIRIVGRRNLALLGGGRARILCLFSRRRDGRARADRLATRLRNMFHGARGGGRDICFLGRWRHVATGGGRPSLRGSRTGQRTIEVMWATLTGLFHGGQEPACE